jgi:hypothetical protein
MAPNEAVLRAFAPACTDLEKAAGNWNTLNRKDLPAFNAVLAKHSIAAIAPAPPLALSACGAPPARHAKAAKQPG